MQTIIPEYKFRNVSERDMDLLFMEAFISDPGFSALFIRDALGYNDPYTILSVERSKVDTGLGESDLTVRYEVRGIVRGLLIEDKIDAIAMPDQHARYVKRGEKGVSAGEYNGFDVFIICPERYRQSNDEAAKYEHFISYEQCRYYFESNSDIISQIRFRQISQALETAKREYKIDINEVAVESFKKYAEYQQMFYPALIFKNNTQERKINGWWPQFGTTVKGRYTIHKTPPGCVDSTIPGAADRLSKLKVIEKWLRDGGHDRITVVQTNKSAAFRIQVPIIHMNRPFDTWKMGDLNACFDAVQELSDLASMFGVIDDVIINRRE